MRDAKFAPDGKTVATTSIDGTARLWDAASGKLLATLKGHKDRSVHGRVQPGFQAPRHRE